MLGQLCSANLDIEGDLYAPDDSPCAAATQVIAALNTCLTTDQVAKVLVDDGGHAVQASGGVLAVLNDDRRQLLVVRAIGCLAELGGAERRVPLSADLPLAEVARTGQGVWLADAEPLDGRSYWPAATDGGCGVRATLPLAVDGIVLGVAAWCFCRLGPSPAPRDELRWLARAGGEAVYRAAVYQRERTARETAERALRHAAATLDGLPEAILGIDQRGRCCEANRAAQRLLQRSREALIDTTIWELLPANLGPPVRLACERALDAGAEDVVTVTSVAAGCRLAARVEPTATGAVVSITRLAEEAAGGARASSIDACLDVTERESIFGEAHLRVLSEVGAILDTTPDPSAALTRVGAACLPLLGEWCTVDLFDTPAQRRAARRARLRRESGFAALLVVPLHLHDRTLGTLTFATSDPSRQYDPSDLAFAYLLGRRCATAIEWARLARRAQEALQARDEFVAATSHELRTPLSHIKGFVSTLRAPDAVWDAATRDDFLAEIEREADRLARLVDDLLDMTRTEARGLDPSALATTSAATLIGRGVDRIGGSLDAHGLEVDVADDLPMVRVDATQIERVIANLLHNAAKYSPPTEPIRVVARRADESIHVRVEDRGLGIPPEVSERIFEPFFRVPAGSYPVKPGSGLGLAICRSIVRAHGGRIWVEQRPGGGAAFVFSLPIAGPPRPPA